MKEKRLLDRLLQNKILARSLSVVLGFAVWLAVVITVSPSSTRVIQPISVTLDTQSGFLSEAGLSLVDKTSANVSVEISGPRAVIGRLDASDFTVTPDVGPVTKSGDYTLNLSASLKTPNSQVKIRSVSPSTLRVSFDTVTSKTLPVTVKVRSESVAGGYVMETATASPKTVIVSGPSAEVARVGQVIADVDVGAGLNATYNGKAILRLTDDAGNNLDLDHVKKNVDTVSVTVPVFKTTDAPLSVSFSNLPTGFDTANIQTKITPSTLRVAGSDDEIAALSQISLGSIDFSTLGLKNTLTLPVSLSGTLQNLDNVETASVSVTLLNTLMKAVSVSGIQAVNVPSGYTVKVRTQKIDNVQLFGPTAQMASPPALTAQIDCSQVLNGTGQYEVPVSLTVPSGYWTTGSYTAVVQVSRK